MNITFFIGNGFDLNLGLNTRYDDFYRYYKHQMKDSEDLLSNSIRDESNYEMWSDMEIGLGKLLEDVGENQVEEFLDSKLKLEELLVRYLKAEQQRIVINEPNVVGTELYRHILNFQNEFNAVEKERFLTFLNEARQQIHYCFVSFNYTSVLDEMLKAVADIWVKKPKRTSKGALFTDKLDDLLHIHGNLTDGIILGLDNQEQISNERLKTDTRLNNYIIKSNVNMELGERRIEDTRRIINQSRYICLFGLSFGETDRFWWEYLIKWLKRDSNNRLVLYIYGSNGNSVSGPERIRNRDKEREKFIERSGCGDADDVKDRIIVIFNTDTFSFSKITLLEHAEIEEYTIA